MYNAVISNHLDALKWLDTYYPTQCTSHTLVVAAKDGRLDMVKCILSPPRPWEMDKVMSGAAAYGHLRVVQYLFKHFPERSSPNLMKSAVCGGQLEVVKWLFFDGKQPHYAGCEVDASFRGNIAMLEFIRTHSNNCGNPSVYSSAYGNGHVEVGLWYTEHFGQPQKRRRL